MNAEVKKIIEEVIKHKPELLDLMGLGLTSIPKEIAQMDWLKTLYLKNNQIQKIENLNDNLTRLDLGFNQIQKIENLNDNLKELDLRSNQIQKIENLNDNLKELNLRSNQIQKIENLNDNLKELNLRSNQIQKIENLNNNLKELNLISNQIQKIENLKKNLTHLQLDNNLIKNLAESWSEILKSNLKIIWNEDEYANEGEINLYGNPLELPSVEIMKEEHDTIARQMKRLIKSKVYLNEAKVLIVGRTGAGKTSLRYKLKDPNKKMPKPNESTEGVDVETVFIEGEDGKKYRINLWDFEGQQISYQTHQFFLTKRSLYLFVIDNRTEKNDFEYWLPVIELLGGKSPTLLFHNEREGQYCSVNLSNLMKTYGDFVSDKKHRSDLNAVAQFDSETKELLPTYDSKQRKSFDNFTDFLKEQIPELPIISTPVTEPWLNVRTKIEERTKDDPYISKDEFEKICLSEDITEEVDRDDLSRLFHDLGIFLHFQDPKKPSLLDKMVILQKEWATKAVYKVMKSEFLKNEKKGKFTVPDLREVWKEKNEYRKNAGELLELMKRFELVYQIGESEFHIAPQLLPNSSPETYVFPEEGQLFLKFKYSFMPKGMLTRLAVRMHRDIADEQELAWIDGFVLKKYGATAEISETYEGKEIFVKASGPNKKKLLLEVVLKINELNRDLKYDRQKRIKAHLMLPCKCEDCIDSDSPQYQSYDRLVNIKRKNPSQDEDFCNDGNEVSINAILDTIMEGSGVGIGVGVQLVEGFSGNEISSMKMLEIMNTKFEDIGKFMDKGFSRNEFLHKKGFEKHEQTHQKIEEIPAKVKAELESDLNKILEDLSDLKFSDAKNDLMLETISGMTDLIEKNIRMLPKELQGDLQKVISEELPMKLDAKGKLEVAIPLIPGILSYKTEVSTDFKGDARAKLKAMWEDFKTGKAFLEEE